jgi:hypothetical protein
VVLLLVVLYLSALSFGCLHRTARLQSVARHAGPLWAAATALGCVLAALFSGISAVIHAPPRPSEGAADMWAAWEVLIVGAVWAPALAALGEAVRAHDRKKVSSYTRTRTNRYGARAYCMTKQGIALVAWRNKVCP